jgi:hypothetical protein
MTDQTISEQLNTIQTTKAFTDGETVDPALPVENKGTEFLNNQEPAKEIPAEADPVVPAENDPDSPLYKGTFATPKTQEELLAYTQRLEQEVIKNKYNQQQDVLNTELNAQTLGKVSNPSAETEMTDEQINKMYEDPKGFASDITNQIKADLQQESNKDKALDNFWASFYSENPDLQINKRVVTSILNEQWPNIEKLPFAQSKTILAAESRKLILEIRRGEGERKEMTNAAPVNLSNKNPAPAGEVTPTDNSTFIDQVKAQRAKRSGAK